jgi:hypothetical protein
MKLGMVSCSRDVELGYALPVPLVLCCSHERRISWCAMLSRAVMFFPRVCLTAQAGVQRVRPRAPERQTQGEADSSIKQGQHTAGRTQCSSSSDLCWADNSNKQLFSSADRSWL